MTWEPVLSYDRFRLCLPANVLGIRGSGKYGRNRRSCRRCTAWRHVADQLRPRFPKLAALVDEAEADVLAFMGFARALAEYDTVIDATKPPYGPLHGQRCADAEGEK